MSALRSAGTAAVLQVELRKLVAQKRTRFTLAGCLIGPFATAVVLAGQQRPPKDTLYGRHIHESGLASALFVLTFVSQWALPFVTAIVAGDIFASEDHFGTWKTILTRSSSRASIFWAKVVASSLFAGCALVVLAVSSIGAGIVTSGTGDLVGLTGQPIAWSHGLVLVVAAWASVLPPLLAFTALAVLLSVLSRNPSVGVAGPIVIGLLLQLLGWLGGMDTARRLLPSTAFDAWHGLFTEQRFYGLLVQGAGVSMAWTALFAGIAFAVLRRRDVTGG